MIGMAGPPRFLSADREPTSMERELVSLEVRRLRRSERRTERLVRAVAGGLRLLADALDPPRTYMSIDEATAALDAWAEVETKVWDDNEEKDR